MAVVNECTYTCSFTIPTTETSTITAIIKDVAGTLISVPINVDTQSVNTIKAAVMSAFPDATKIAIVNMGGVQYWTLRTKIKLVSVQCFDQEATTISTPFMQSACRLLLDKAVVRGCTDTVALNYNSLATEEDGSCQYEPLTLTEQLRDGINDLPIGKKCCDKKIRAYLNTVLRMSEQADLVADQLVAETLAFATLDFSGIDFTLLIGEGDVVLTVVPVTGSSYVLARLGIDFGTGGYIPSVFVETLVDQINSSSTGYTAEFVGLVATIYVADGTGASLNDATLEIGMDDTYQQSAKLIASTSNTASGIIAANVDTQMVYVPRTSVAIGTISTYDSNDDTIASLAPAVATLPIKAVHVPLMIGHKGFIKGSGYTAPTAGTAYCFDIRQSDDMVFSAIGNSLQMSRASTGAIIGSIALGIAAYMVCVNQTTGKIYCISPTDGTYKEVTWADEFTPPSAGSAISNVFGGFNTGMAVYCTLNNCVYAGVGGGIIRISAAGTVSHNVSTGAGDIGIAVNEYTGEVYTTVMNASNAIVTYSATLTSPVTTTLPFTTKGRITANQGVDAATFRLYLSMSTNKVIKEFNGSLTLTNTYVLPVLTWSAPSCQGVFYCKTTNRLLVAVLANSVYSIYVYDYVNNKVEPRVNTAQTGVIGSAVLSAAECLTVGVYIHRSVTGVIEKFVYVDESANTQGQVWVIANGFIKIYNISGDTLIESAFRYDSAYSFSDITYSGGYVYLSIGGVQLPRIYWIEASTLGGFETADPVGVQNALFPTSLDFTTTGLYSSYRVVGGYNNSVWILGQGYPSLSGNSRIVVVKQGVIQPDINNGLIGYKDLVFNSNDNLVYALDADGILTAFDDNLVVKSTRQLDFSPGVLSAYMAYDPTSNRVIISVGSGIVYIVNPKNGQTVESFDIFGLYGYNIKSIIYGGASKTYISAYSATNTYLIIISHINGISFYVTGIFQDGVTEIESSDSDICLPLATIEQKIEQAKQYLKNCTNE